MAFPKCNFPAPVPCRILPGLRGGKSPSGMGHKQRTQEGCDRAPAIGPSKSLLEMQEQETASSPFCKKGSPRGSLLPSRICPSNRRLRQRRRRHCILLLMLAEDGLESMVLWAGDLSSAQLPGALLLVLPTCLFILPACGFHFLLGEGVGSCNKSCHRQSFNR